MRLENIYLYEYLCCLSLQSRRPEERAASVSTLEDPRNTLHPRRPLALKKQGFLRNCSTYLAWHYAQKPSI